MARHALIDHERREKCPELTRVISVRTVQPERRTETPCNRPRLPRWKYHTTDGARGSLRRSKHAIECSRPIRSWPRHELRALCTCALDVRIELLRREHQCI